MQPFRLNNSYQGNQGTNTNITPRNSISILTPNTKIQVQKQTNKETCLLRNQDHYFKFLWKTNLAEALDMILK